MKEKFDPDPIFVHPGDTDKVFDFKTEEDLKLWMVSSDQDHNEGFSEGSLTISPTGHGLFSGNIDTRIPKDGTVTAAGYSNMTLIQPRRSFKREISFDWIPYSHLAMRIRGDGRRYLLTLKTAGTFDVSWFDMYIYVLYTRGGPYWQDVKIPFSKFLLNAKGRMQDKQHSIPLSRIKTLGLTAHWQCEWPFSSGIGLYWSTIKVPFIKRNSPMRCTRIPHSLIDL
ncbi:UNVERIFIED_CONTAM: hypothetical protein GTU68_064833 [Idotea baltica]|nr:hypothetical protein [Idotea baltica]